MNLALKSNSCLSATVSCPAAARTKLKKMLKDEEAKKAAAVAKSAADRSPHTKEVRTCMPVFNSFTNCRGKPRD